MIHRILPLAAALLAAGSPTLRAGSRVQAPDARWKTIPTAHYRIHHPDRPDFEAFARRVASQIEGIHGLLEREVGHALGGPTDVLIQNPAAASNGMVMSFSKRPTVTLWTEPLESDTEISHESDWVELLVLHELVHLHHLSFEDRKPGILDRMPSALKVNAIARKAPTWVSEGYATQLEGRLTGSGRPHGAYRAMVLRLRASQGLMPSYRGLSSREADALGGTPYLIGSAFLDWLEHSRPSQPRILQDLWKRLSSSRYPTFASGFKATFGEEPEEAYNRFQAELTHTALELERRMKVMGLREGEVWGRIPHGSLADLSLSPDGTHLLARVRGGAEKGGLHVWSLEAKTVDAEERAKADKKDPDLPAPAQELRPERKPTHTLRSANGFGLERPTWTADGTVAFTTRKANGEGIFHRATDTWTPLPATPRPLTTRLLHPRREGNAWVVDVDGRTLPLPFEPFGPLAWDTPRKVAYASTPLDGVLNLVRVSFDPAATQPFGTREPLTRTLGGAAYPAPTPDGKGLYFALLDAKGTEIRHLDLTQGPLPAATLTPEAAPFVPDAVLSAADQPSRVPATVEPPAGRPYSALETHATNLRTGYVFSPSGRALTLGAGGTDVIGKLSWQAQGAIGLPGEHGMGPRGASLGAAWRGWSWAPSFQAFSVLERPSGQRFEPVVGLDRERRGAEVTLTREWLAFPQVGSLKLSAAHERVDLLPGAQATRTVTGADLNQDAAFTWHAFGAGASARLQGQKGRTDGLDWNLRRALVSAYASYEGFDVSAEAESGRLGGSPTRLDRFTLGGQSAGLLGRSLEATSVFQPALPTHLATGDRFERWRVSTGPFYVEGVALWDAVGQRPAYTRVAGFEVKGDFTKLPILRDIAQRVLGRPELSLGLHRPLDGAMKGRTVFTLALVNRF